MCVRFASINFCNDMKHPSIQQIVEKAGGMIQLGAVLNITNNAIRSWYDRGIPRRYWHQLSERTGVAVEAIKKASSKAKTQNASIK